MRSSRISRIDERRTKKQLTLVIFGIIILFILIATIGIPLIIQTSVFVGNIKSKQKIQTQTDKILPMPPVLFPLSEATNSARIKIQGYGLPETTLKVYLNGDEIKKTILGKDGIFSFDDIILKSDKNIIYATITNSNDITSNDSETIIINYLNSPPKLEISEPTDNQVFNRNNQQITIKGTTNINTNVTINERFVSTKDDGSFNFQLKLNDGENNLIIIARDIAGNETQKSLKVIYTP